MSTLITFFKQLGSARYTSKSGVSHTAAIADDGVTVVELNISYTNVQAWVNDVDSRYNSSNSNIFYCEI